MTAISYVPILKGKEGEYAALQVLRPDIKTSLMPLIEVPTVPYDYANERPSKSLDEHIADVPEKLKRALSSTPLFLHLPCFENAEALSSGKTALEVLLRRCVDLDMNPVPVVSRNSSWAYLAAAKEHAANTGCGVCVRFKVEDFGEDVDVGAEVDRLLFSAAPQGVESADLIIDLGDLGTDANRAVMVARSIFSVVPHSARWRRIVLAAASFPKDLSDVSAATVVKLPRYEWDLWKALQAKPSKLPRLDLIFGDYAMAHPVEKALDPRTMQMSANIRYTTEDAWLVVKGRSVRRFGFDQYFDLCQTLVQRPEYSGRLYSWGDGYIADCAESMKGPGNATTWRKVGVNHHLTLVTRGLASFHAAV